MLVALVTFYVFGRRAWGVDVGFGDVVPEEDEE